MADEAVVRILVQEGSGGAAASTPFGYLPGSTPHGLSDEERLRTGREAVAALVGLKKAEVYESQRDAERDAGQKALHEQAMVHLEITRSAEDKRQREIDQERRALHEQAMAHLEATKSAEDKRQLERDIELKVLHEQAMASIAPIQRRIAAAQQRQNEVYRLEKLAHEEGAKRDLEIARERRKRAIEIFREAREAINQAYRPPLPLDAEPAFKPPDPKNATNEARERRERERERQRVDDEYQRLYGKPKPEPENKPKEIGLFDILNALRGTIGSVGGRGVGSVVDVASAMHAATTTKAAAGAGGTGGIGAAGGAVAAAGAIGALVVAIKLAYDAIISMTRTAVSTVGNIAVAMASPDADPSKPIGELGEVASAVGTKLAGMIPPIGMVGIVVGESAKAFSSFMQAATKTAERYSGYSPEISQAQALAEIRQVLGDFRRSQEISGEMSKFLMAQSELQQKYEDYKINALNKILPYATQVIGYMSSILDILEWIRGEKKSSDVKDPTWQLLNDPMFTIPGTGTKADPGLVPRY